MLVAWLLLIAYESGLTLNSESHRRESDRLQIWPHQNLRIKVHDLALRSILSSSNPPNQKLFSHFLPRKSRAPFIPTNLVPRFGRPFTEDSFTEDSCSDRLFSIRAAYNLPIPAAYKLPILLSVLCSPSSDCVSPMCVRVRMRV